MKIIIKDLTSLSPKEMGVKLVKIIPKLVFATALVLAMVLSMAISVVWA